MKDELNSKPDELLAAYAINTFCINNNLVIIPLDRYNELLETEWMYNDLND